jgi:chemotaxis protein CheD
VSRPETLFGLGDLAARMEAMVGGTDTAVEAAPASGREGTAYVHVGQVFASAEPRTVSTILGSCVAVCLWDAGLRAGGLNHFLLPQCMTNGSSSPRFGNVAIRELLESLERLGCAPHRLQAKIFGGASVIETTPSAAGPLGLQNVKLARRILWEIGIPVVAEDVGGTQGRKLVFQTRDGSAWVRKL